MGFSFSGARKQAEDDGLIGGGGFYKLKEGDNRIRLLSECLPHTSTFANGDKSFKWLCYVLDRRTQEVRPFFMGHRIYKTIEELQMSPEYGFSDVPMPYDLTIKAKNAGTMQVEYTVLPARKETPLTEEELDKLAQASPLSDIKDRLREKQKDRAPETPPEPAGAELTADEIPF